MAPLRNYFTDDVVYPFDYHRRELLLYSKSAVARKAKVLWEIRDARELFGLVEISRPWDVLAEKQFKLPPREGVQVCARRSNFASAFVQETWIQYLQLNFKS